MPLCFVVGYRHMSNKRFDLLELKVLRFSLLYMDQIQSVKELPHQDLSKHLSKAVLILQIPRQPICTWQHHHQHQQLHSKNDLKFKGTGYFCILLKTAGVFSLSKYQKCKEWCWIVFEFSIKRKKIQNLLLFDSVVLEYCVEDFDRY